MSHHTTRPTGPGFFKRFLATPVFVADDFKTRTARGLHAVLLANIIFVLPFSLFEILTSERNAMGGLLLLIVTVLTTSTPLFIMRRGKVRLAAAVFLVSSWLLISALILVSGGVTTVFASLYIAVITMALLFFGGRASLLGIGATLIYTLILSFTDLSRIPTLFFISQVGTWLLLCLSLVMVLIPLFSMQQALLRTLANAKEQLATREKAEQMLLDNEERFRLISTVTSDYTFSSRFEAQGTVSHKVLSGAFEKITGYTPEEFDKIGGWDTLLHPDDREQDKRDVAVLRENRPTTSEVRIIRKDGQVCWVRVSAYPIWDDTTQQLVGINGAVQDITERKQAEAALQASEQQYRKTTELISDYAYAFDIHADGTLTCSWVTAQPFKRLSGYDWDDMRAQVMLYHPDDALRARRDTERTAKGEATGGEYRIITASGAIRWIHIERQVEWGDAEGRPIRFYGAAADITERKLAEDALTQERTLLRTVIDQLPDNIFVKDRAGKFVLNNRESLRRLGVSRQEDIIGKTDFDFFPRELAEQWTTESLQIMESGEALLDMETYQEWHDTPHWIAGSVLPLRDLYGAVIGLIGINRDITARKQAEVALSESEAQLRALLDATIDVAFLMSHDFRFLTLNKPMAATLGRTVDELIGEKGFDLLLPEDRLPRIAHFNEAAQSKQPIRWMDGREGELWDNCVYPVLSPTGEVASFAVFSRNITEEARLATELQRYATQLEHMVEERTSELRRAKDQIEIILNNTRDAIALAHPNGDIQTRNPAFINMFGEQVSRWIEGLLWTVSSEDQGDAVGQALVNMLQSRQGQRIETQIMVDDTGDKDIDLMFIPVNLAGDSEQPGILVSAHDITRLKDIERFKARFVADAVHDLATPIVGLTTRLYLLKRSPEKLDVHIKALENQVEHFRDLLADLRTLSQLDRKQMTLDLQTVNLEQNIMRVFDTYEPVALSKDQTLELVLDPNLPDMQLDRRQIERVFLNLVSNAINYTPEGKPICIRVSLEDNGIVFSVTDEGIGISAEELPHVFERFYRTDRARQTRSGGTGLGLAIVKEIIELHGGTVTVQSEIGKGSTFTVRLPIKP